MYFYGRYLIENIHQHQFAYRNFLLLTYHQEEISVKGIKARGVFVCFFPVLTVNTVSLLIFT